jgi:4'-phosphopantetheinyl transferase EntD
MCFEDAFTIIFSAKESLFKALYPSVGYYFDFLDVVVTGICNNTNSFNIMLNVDLTPELRAKTKFKGFFFQNNSEIITIIPQ